MKQLIHNLPVRHKLSAIVMVTSLTVLMISYSFFIANFWLNSREQLVISAYTLTKAVSINASAVLVFGDDATAKELLHTFSVDKDIEYAVLRNKQGAVFAEYATSVSTLENENVNLPSIIFPPAASAVKSLINNDGWHYKFFDNYLVLEQLIEEQGRVIGSLGVRVSLASYKLMIHDWIMFGLVVLSAVLLLGYFISSRLQKVIIHPIEKLVHTMRVVSEVNDYSRRVENNSTDEFGVMVDGFNIMIGQIQTRDEELKHARDIAEEASRAKSRFLATMSHEIRTPMNGVLGMTELLLSSPLSDDQQRYATTIHRSGAALLNIINDILDYSKIEAGQLKLECICFDLYEKIEEVMQLLSEMVSGKKIAISHTFDPDFSGRMTGDPVRVNQILMNLLGNAIKFTHAGRVNVKVLAELSGSFPFVRVEIHDSGPGICEEAQEKIFESFSQEDSSTTRKYGGTGLGLAICQQLVDLMQGRLGVQSTVGLGSVFWFELPLSIQDIIPAMNAKELLGVKVTPSPVTLLTSTHTPLAELEGRILLVDDNVVNQQVATGLLRLMGCVIDTAENGSEAIDRWHEQRYDLILMDIEMPVMDGIEATNAIREEEQRKRLTYTPIVAVTANAMDGDRELYLSMGMDDYLSKPFSRHSLHQLLTVWLKERSVEDTANATKQSIIDYTDMSDLNMQKLEGLNDLQNEHGRPLLESLIHTYIENSNQILSDMDQAIKHKDFEEVRRLVHALKSSSGTIGLDKVHALSREVERGCRLSHTDNIEAQYQLLVKANQSAQQKLLVLE
ncbi:response regulator [Neptunomonas antarctica]|uniref:histidine kinase n=1 Tax=Neptunomonas antarctica TaxID=619304 RepID=A0A1N7NLS9_9GAMM|nr:response regulator [Neptunomonas antarctica]SIS99326.1 Hpt sensor hybrid histidine kinase [Neptunomonas antarctica]